MRPIHPGEVLLDDFLKPMSISQYRLAKEISVPPRRINEIVQKKRGITADTALRLGRYFNMSPEFWINLQGHYDLEAERDNLADKLEKTVRVYAASLEIPRSLNPHTGLCWARLTQGLAHS
jgi:addiction module HigA family antidote